MAKKEKKKEARKGQPTDLDALRAAPQVYANRINITTSFDDVAITFGVRGDPLVPAYEEFDVMLPGAIIYLNHNHARWLADVLDKQLKRLDKRIEEFHKQQSKRTGKKSKK